MVRAAAKNFRDVLVVVDPADYPQVVDELRASGGPSLEFRFELMQKAFAHTAAYDSTIAGALRTGGGGATARRPRSASDARRMRHARIFATARTRISPPAGLHGPSRSDAVGACIRARSSGSPTSWISMRRAGSPRVRRAGGARDQTHEPVRRGHGRDDCRRLCERARRGRAVGVWRDRRPESHARRRAAQALKCHLHRGRDRAGRRRGRRARSWRPSRTCGSWSADFDRAGDARPRAARVAVVSRRHAGAGARRVTEAQEPWPSRAICPKVVTNVRRRPRNGWRCVSRGGSARTSSRTP